MVAPPAQDDLHGIVTPEAIRLDFADAGLGSRALGFVLDLLARLAIVWAVLTGAALLAPLIGETGMIIAGFVLVFAMLLVYPVVCEMLWNGKTLGKMALGLRAVTIEGAPLRFRHSVIRSALGLVDFLLGFGTVAILSALLTRRSQRLGDLAAGTMVIRERQAGASAQPIEFRPPPGWEGYVGALDVRGLDADGYVLVRTFLLRVHEFRAGIRGERGAQLATWVAGEIGTPVPARHPPEMFLIAVAAAYQARHGGVNVATTGRFGPAAPGEIPAPVWHEPQPSATWGVTTTP